MDLNFVAGQTAREADREEHLRAERVVDDDSVTFLGSGKAVVRPGTSVRKRRAVDDDDDDSVTFVGNGKAVVRQGTSARKRRVVDDDDDDDGVTFTDGGDADANGNANDYPIASQKEDKVYVLEDYARACAYFQTSAELRAALESRLERIQLTDGTFKTVIEVFAHEHDKVLLVKKWRDDNPTFGLCETLRAVQRGLTGANKRWVFVTGDGYCCTWVAPTHRKNGTVAVAHFRRLTLNKQPLRVWTGGVVGTQSVAHARAIENFVDIAKNTPFIVKTPCSAFDEETGKRCEGLEDEYDFTGDQFDAVTGDDRCSFTVSMDGVDRTFHPDAMIEGPPNQPQLDGEGSQADPDVDPQQPVPYLYAEIEKTHPNDEDKERGYDLVMAPFCQFIESSLNDVHAEWKEKGSDFKPELVHCPAGRKGTAGQFCLACRVPELARRQKHIDAVSSHEEGAMELYEEAKNALCAAFSDGVAAIKLWPLLDDVVNRWQLWQHYRRKRDQHNCSCEAPSLQEEVGDVARLEQKTGDARRAQTSATHAVHNVHDADSLHAARSACDAFEEAIGFMRSWRTTETTRLNVYADRARDHLQEFSETLHSLRRQVGDAEEAMEAARERAAAEAAAAEEAARAKAAAEAAKAERKRKQEAVRARKVEQVRAEVERKRAPLKAQLQKALTAAEPTAQTPANFKDIADLRPGQDDWTVRGKIDSITPPRPMRNGAGPFRLIYFVNNGKTYKATCFGSEMVDHVSTVFEGHEYWISGAEVRAANREDQNCSKDVKITLNVTKFTTFTPSNAQRALDDLEAEERREIDARLRVPVKMSTLNVLSRNWSVEVLVEDKHLKTTKYENLYLELICYEEGRTYRVVVWDSERGRELYDMVQEGKKHRISDARVHRHDGILQFALEHYSSIQVCDDDDDDDDDGFVSGPGSEYDSEGNIKADLPW